MTLGEQIRARRRALGLTLMQVADQVGVSYQWLSSIERSADTPLSTLMRVLVALGMRLMVEVDDE